MAVSDEDDDTEDEEQPQEQQQWLEPNAIVSDAYKSLDAQIAKLDRIPEDAKTACDALLEYAVKKELFSPDGQVGFYEVLGGTDEQLGHCIHAVLEIERERVIPPKEPTVTPMALPSIESPMQTVQVQGVQPGQQQPPITVKTGALAEFFRGRALNKATEKLIAFQREQMNRPEITTSKVKDILDYGRELLPEYNKLYEFYDKALKRLRFFDDAETVWNQRQEIVNEIVKITGVIRAFSRAVVEYRKERFGDRKVGVASGVMWLAASIASAPPMMMKPPPPGDKLSDLLRENLRRRQEGQTGP